MTTFNENKLEDTFDKLFKAVSNISKKLEDNKRHAREAFYHKWLIALFTAIFPAIIGVFVLAISNYWESRIRYAGLLQNDLDKQMEVSAGVNNIISNIRAFRYVENFSCQGQDYMGEAVWLKKEQGALIYKLVEEAAKVRLNFDIDAYKAVTNFLKFIDEDISKNTSICSKSAASDDSLRQLQININTVMYQQITDKEQVIKNLTSWLW